ncbi:MAG: 50S ribosomal protein L20 [Planctomycetes bacterium]|nr:50S ribosomal protein L20 [Planctomycetota bacterium]MCK5578293.1 50S ribosomal protein L20 [Planctomycetota bacterium]
MPKARTNVARHKRVRKVRKATKGFYGGRGNLYKAGLETLRRGGNFAYTSRKLRKRDYRGLWIIRISAAAKAIGIPYHRLMNGLKKAKVQLDRKMLAEIALTDPAAFQEIVTVAKKALA